jgi:hypothetical protein
VAGEGSRRRAPGRSAGQRLEALRKANEIRSARAQLKKDIAAGRVRIDEVLRDPPACARTAKVDDLLLALPGFGKARVGRLLIRLQISESKTLAGLSDRQRTALIGHLQH